MPSVGGKGGGNFKNKLLINVNFIPLRHKLLLYIYPVAVQAVLWFHQNQQPQRE